MRRGLAPGALGLPAPCTGGGSTPCRYVRTASTRRCPAAPGRELELGEDARDVALDHALAHAEAVGDRLVGLALGHAPEHLALARRELVERALGAAAVEHPRHDLGIERRAALPDLAHRVGERVAVGHAVLEQVADALGALPQQLDRVGHLDVLREHEHARARQLLADRRGPPRSPSSVCVGRHPDVDDRHVGPVRAHLAHELVGVAGLRHDVEAGRLQARRRHRCAAAPSRRPRRRAAARPAPARAPRRRRARARRPPRARTRPPSAGARSDALASAPASTSPSAHGRSGRTSSSHGGASWTCAHIFSTSLSRSNTTWPVSDLNSTQPSA